jgi:hypothetical protein
MPSFMTSVSVSFWVRNFCPIAYPRFSAVDCFSNDERPSIQKREFPTGETAQVCRGMKANWFVAALFELLAVCSEAVSYVAQPPLGLPEPGLLLVGAVANAAGGLPLPSSNPTWKILSSRAPVRVAGTLREWLGQ